MLIFAYIGATLIGVAFACCHVAWMNKSLDKERAERDKNKP